MKFVLALSFLSLVGIQLNAANQKAFDKKFKDYAYSYPAPVVTVLSKQENLDAIKKIILQEGKRKLANTVSEEWFESKMSPEFKKIRDAILLISTGEQLDDKLAELEKNYNYLKESDSKFFAAQVIPLRAMRGMIWRLKGLVEGNKLAHSVVLTTVKNVFVGANMFFPTDQTKAMSEYLTQPFVEDGQAPWTRKGEICLQFEKASEGGEAELQAHVINVVIPILETSAERLSHIQISGDWRVFDNRMWYGGDTFPDAIDRYALVGEVERFTALSAIYSTISSLSFQAAYSWNSTLDMNESMAKLYGWDSMTFTVDGVPIKKRKKVLDDNRFAAWGVLQFPNLVSKSWENLKNSTTAAENAWQGMKTRAISEYTLIDNSRALPFQRVSQAKFTGMKDLFDGESTVFSSITREKVQVNLKAFFDGPPKNLRQLYPKEFVEGNEMLPLVLKTSSGDKKVEYRNYKKGSGRSWDLSEDSPYRKLFPKVSSDAEFKKGIQVLSQSWGSSMVAFPLTDYLY